MERTGRFTGYLSGKRTSSGKARAAALLLLVGCTVWLSAQEVPRKALIINDLREPQRKSPAQLQSTGKPGIGLIPTDRYRAHFGEGHKFHLSPAVYGQDRHFQYGGYSFGFVDEWPTNWLSKETVFIVQIEGGYYLCNSKYPGIAVPVSIAASSADSEASLPSARPKTSKTSRTTVGPARTAKTG